LILNSISIRCPDCKEHGLIPVFVCSYCGKKYTHLIPGIYGAFSQKCECGHIIPCTFLNGRSKLTALCSHCGTELASSNARQFGIQLVGGISSGKTAFLASFFHLYNEHVNNIANINIRTYPKAAFRELEQWFQNGSSEPTKAMNAGMYSIVHTKGKSGVSHELALYDISGKAFTAQSVEKTQKQYQYCGGIIFIVDPLSIPDVRAIYKNKHNGQDPVNFSKSNNTEVATGFISNYIKQGYIETGKRSTVPVSVVISKTDIDVIKKEIGIDRIMEEFNKNPEAYNSTAEIARDTICRKYLVCIGMAGMVNNLIAQFMNIHFYPVSAIGHEANKNEPYNPNGVLESVLWIIRDYNPALAGMLNLKQQPSRKQRGMCSYQESV
jgi:hypothetical protein